MSIKVIYPHDPNGELEECLIHEESHTLLTNDNTYRVIIPELAPFFKKDLVIIHAPSRKELKEGTDYELGFHLLSAKKVANRTLYGCIRIINKLLKGEFIVTYRTVGSNYVGIKSDVLTYLANANIDPVKTPFDKLIDRPSYYAPAKHEQNYHDFVNKEAFASEIDELAQAILDSMELAEDTAIADLIARIEALDDILERFRQDLHNVRTDDPHDATWLQADALYENDASKSSFKAYSKTLVELAEYINSRNLTQADIDLYLNKHGSQALKDKLTLKEGVAKLRNLGNTCSIDLATGNVTIEGESLIKGRADKENDKAGKKVVIKAGENKLEIVSSGHPELGMDKLLFNGYEVIHADNVEDRLKGHGATGMRVITEETDTVAWVGDSRPLTKLAANGKFAVATLTERGIIRLSNEITDDTILSAPTAWLVNEVRLQLIAKVPKSRKVMGYTLETNIVLDKDDFGLSEVENTSDADKPISLAQQALLDKYSEVGHVHDFSEDELLKANELNAGVFRFRSDVSQETEPGDVATPKMVKQYIDKVNTLSDLEAGLMHSGAVDVKYWKALEDVTVSGFNITFPAAIELYMNATDYANSGGANIAEYVLDLNTVGDPANKDLYLYVEIVDGDVVYRAMLDETTVLDDGVCLGAIQTDDTTVKNVTAVLGSTDHYYTDNVNGVLAIAPTTSTRDFIELQEHLDDDNAHAEATGRGDKALIGLSNVENYPCVDYVSDYALSSLPNWLNTSQADNEKLSFTDFSLSSGHWYNLTFNRTGTNLGQPMAMFRNTHANFLDPAYLCTTPDKDGLYKRKLCYLLSNEEGRETLYGAWGIIGNHVAENGDIYDLVIKTPSKSEGRNYIELVLMKNGGNVKKIISKAFGSDDVTFEFQDLYIVYEFWNDSEGKHLRVDIQHDGFDDTYESKAKLTQFITTVTLSGNNCKWKAEKVFHAAGQSNKVETETGTYAIADGLEKEVFYSGKIGFGITAWELATLSTQPGDIGGAPTPSSSYTVSIDCIAADEGNMTDRYISASAVHEVLKAGAARPEYARTVLAEGTKVHLRRHARYNHLYLGLNDVGITSSPITQLDLNLVLRTTGATVDDLIIDMTSPERHVKIKCGTWHSNGNRIAGIAEVIQLGLRDL